jgi:hypothetical protein
MSLGKRSRPRRTTHPIQVDDHGPQPALTADDAYAADLSQRVAAAALHRCQAQIHRDCPGRGDQAHHRWRRSHQGPDTVENCRWVCHLCHDVIHFRRVGWARRHLWLIDSALGHRLTAAGQALPDPLTCLLDCEEDHRPFVSNVLARWGESAAMAAATPAPSPVFVELPLGSPLDQEVPTP